MQQMGSIYIHQCCYIWDAQPSLAFSGTQPTDCADWLPASPQSSFQFNSASKAIWRTTGGRQLKALKVTPDFKPDVETAALRFSLHVFDAVGSDSLGHKLHRATQRGGLVVKEGLLQVHLPHWRVLLSDFTHSVLCMYLLKIKNLSIGLACSFCCDLLAAGASLGSAEVGVIFRMIPPLLAVLPDTNAARSLRNSPGTMMMKKKRLRDIDTQLLFCGPFVMNIEFMGQM